MSSAFSPETFLGGNYQEGFDTRYPLHKAGDWKGYIGKDAKDLHAREVQTQEGPRVIVDLSLYTDNPSAMGEGQAKPPSRARLTLWIDQTPQGGLDRAPGKNRVLGTVLTALGFQDKTGAQVKPWGWKDFHGRALAYRVVHEPRKDTGDLVAVVSGVTAQA